jgi:hypothetical protein
VVNVCTGPVLYISVLKYQVRQDTLNYLAYSQPNRNFIFSKNNTSLKPVCTTMGKLNSFSHGFFFVDSHTKLHEIIILVL